MSRFYSRMGVRVWLAALAAWMGTNGAAMGQEPMPEPPDSTQPEWGSPLRQEPSVFNGPVIDFKRQMVLRQLLALSAAKRLDDAEKLLLQALRDADLDKTETHYNLACVYALQGNTDRALECLAAAIQGGYADVAHMRKDPDLKSLQGQPRFEELLKQAGKASAVRPLPAPMRTAPVTNGTARVAETNTQWVSFLQRFVVGHEFPAPSTNAPITTLTNAAGNLLRQWQGEGTASGLHGVLYDNRDKGHSAMRMASFPQMARLVYDAAAEKRGLARGAQLLFLHNATVLGNASLANTSGPFWRGMARQAYADGNAVRLLADQYLNNHLYAYPEHRDHDPDFGDVSPAHTPYLLVSQGSSGSDQAFLTAAACTLAAFRPETRRLLVSTNLLMPTFQMILRMCRKPVEKPEDYLTGKAHPAVFDSATLDVEKMVRMAHDLKPGEVPPLVRLKAVEEDEAEPGVDYFEAGPAERLFDTVSAIGRVARASRWERRLVVSAEETKDPNGRPLKFEWRLLRGDPERVKIRTLDAAGARAELRVAWHERGVLPGSDIASSRVDIGVFAHNGVRVSAPAFVTWYFPANEKRTYDEKRRIVSIAYLPPSPKESYVDPMVVTPADWIDAYRYDPAGKLLGWTRTRGKESEEFTADGRLVTARGADGKPAATQAVAYRREQKKADAWPVLVQLTAPAVTTGAAQQP